MQAIVVLAAMVMGLGQGSSSASTLLVMVSGATAVAGPVSPGDAQPGGPAQARPGADLDVRDFGARCDGVADDTVALQAAIDAASTRGGTVRLPPCALRITATIRLRNLTGLTLSGHGDGLGDPTKLGGTLIVWDGGEGAPAFLLDGVRYSLFEGFSISTQRFAANPVAKPLTAGFICQNGPGGPGQVLSTANEWRRVSVYGRQGDGPAVESGWTFRDPRDGRSTGLNEGMIFHRTQVKNFSGTGYSFGMAQSAMNRFFHSSASSYGLGGTGWYAAAGANFFVYGGSSAGNAIDFYVAGSANNFTIENFISEGSARFLEGAVAPWTAAPVVVINSTFNDGGRTLHPDGHVIKWPQRSLVLIGFTVKGASDKARSILFDARPNAIYSFMMLACSLATSLDGGAAFPAQRPSVMLGTVIGTTLRPNVIRFSNGTDGGPIDAEGSGRLSISNLDRTASVTFQAPEPDTRSWYVIAIPDGVQRGGAEIPIGARLASTIERRKDGFTLTLETPPGEFNRVDWRWFKVRGGDGAPAPRAP